MSPYLNFMLEIKNSPQFAHGPFNSVSKTVSTYTKTLKQQGRNKNLSS
jgi:hypothetical protein